MNQIFSDVISLLSQLGVMSYIGVLFFVCLGLVIWDGMTDGLKGGISKKTLHSDGSMTDDDDY